MTPIRCHRDHGPLSPADLRYIKAHYLPLRELRPVAGLEEPALAELILTGKLPQPAYVLPDGEPVFPRDFLALLESAGSVEGLRSHFGVRYEGLARELGLRDEAAADREWLGYLTGEYGLCLWQVTPENVLLKERLVTSLTSALAAPFPDDPSWRAMLKAKVRQLDALVRPFAPCDRYRFGGPVSRDRVIDAPRQQYAWL